MKRVGHGSVSIALTVVIGFLIYREVPDWSEAGRIMIEGRPFLLLAGFLFIMLHMILRSLRWGVLLAPVKSGISLKNLFSLTLVKYVVNVIPPRAGEIAASVVLAKKEKIPSASVIAASMLERILDIVAVIVIFGFYLFFFAGRYLPASGRGREILEVTRNYSIAGFAVMAAGFALLAWLLRSSSWANRIPTSVRSLVFSFLDGLRALESRGALFRAVLLSVTIWLVITVQLWCLTRAYLSMFPFAGALLVMALTVVGVAIPTPGGVGGFQFFMSLALIHFFPRYLSAQDPYSQAAGISNGCYLVSMVPIMTMGLIFLNREGLTLSRISELSRARARKEKEIPAEERETEGVMGRK